jgi:hypothetical protein
MNEQHSSRRKRRSHRYLVAAATVGSLTVLAAHAASAIPSTTTDTVVNLTHNQELLATGGTFTPILTMEVPAGSYVFTATGDVVNRGPVDILRCVIWAGGVAAGGGIATAVGTSGSSGPWPASQVAGMSLVGSAHLGGPTQITLSCLHDKTSSGQMPYVDRNMVLWAHRTTSLNIFFQ